MNSLKGIVCRAPDTTKKTTLWVAFFVVREAGVEPARPEWTLEPESEKALTNLCWQISGNAEKSL